MKEEKPTKGGQREKLPEGARTVGYPPPSIPQGFPVRGGKREPDKYDQPKADG